MSVIVIISCIACVACGVLLAITGHRVTSSNSKYPVADKLCWILYATVFFAAAILQIIFPTHD